jgi:hypothetical protein
MRRVALALAIVVGSSGWTAASVPMITVREITSPAAGPALAPAMTLGPDRAVWLSWVQRGGDAATATESEAHGHHAPSGVAAPSNSIRVARLNPDVATWTKPHDVVANPSVSANPADYPQVVVDGGGAAHALWTDGHGGAFWSTSRDGGQAWSSPQPWTKRSTEVEKFTWVRLADGRVLVAWLDARDHRNGGGRQSLYARMLDADEESELRVDGSVCDCCQTSLTALLDGGALLAYRGRTEEDVRDINVARFHHGSWTEPHRFSADEWRITGCPVNGPRIASDGSRAAAAWFTGADNEPRVLASYSPDAAARWLMPLRIDRGHPAGHVTVVLLRDGAFAVVWLENDGSLWLRRVTPEFALSDPVNLALAGSAQLRGFPQAVLLRDYAGERTHATLLVAYTANQPTGGVRTLLVDVPEGDLVTAERNCDCAPTLEQLQGFAIRGRVTAVDATRHSAQAVHGEVPGVFDPGTHVFGLAPADFATLQPGREFLGRVEWRDGGWRLFDLRYLATGAK